MCGSFFLPVEWWKLFLSKGNSSCASETRLRKKLATRTISDLTNITMHEAIFPPRSIEPHSNVVPEDPPSQRMIHPPPPPPTNKQD